MSEEDEKQAQTLREVAREWLVGGPQCNLIHDWIRFNLSPTQQQAQQIWAKDLPSHVVEALIKDRRARNYIDSSFREMSPKRGWTYWSPEDPVWHLAFLPLEKFGRLAKLAGVYCAQEAISHTVEGATVRRLRNNIGNEFIEFALLRSPYLKLEKPPSCVISEWKKDPVKEIVAAGCECITQAFSHRTVGMQLRISQKLPGVFPNGPVESPLPYNKIAAKCLVGLSDEVGALL